MDKESRAKRIIFTEGPYEDKSVLSIRDLNFLDYSPKYLEYVLNQTLDGPSKFNNLAFDAGILPEIVIRPPKDNAVFKTKYMIPNKELRNSFYGTIDDDIDGRLYINRLWELYKKSQYPSIRNLQKSPFNIVRLYGKITGDEDRPNYNPITNTMYVSPTINDTAEEIEAELSHAYQHYGTDMPRKYGWLRSFSSLPGDIKINGRSGYNRIGNTEFDAHRIIEPLFNAYITDPKINYNDMHDIMMDMYENPNLYFKEVKNGPFSGAVRRKLKPPKR